MRYVWLGVVVGLLLTGCWSAPPAPPTPDVPALQTQAAALRAVNDAQATHDAPAPTTPPVEATRLAVLLAWGDVVLHAHPDDPPATRTAQARVSQALIATLTALPTP